MLDLALGRRPDGKQNRKNVEYELTSSQYALTRHQGRAGSLPEPLRFYGFPDEVAAYYQNTAFAADLVLELERLLRSVFYVGPLREYPKRLYLWSGEVPDHVGARGDRATSVLSSAIARQLEADAKDEVAPAVVATTPRHGLIHEFQVKALAGTVGYEVLVRTIGLRSATPA